MDSVAGIRNRSEKVYKHKLENHVKMMKNYSSKPKIDELSRKVAEKVTQKELEILGIDQYDTPIKRSYYSLPLPNPAKNPAEKPAEVLNPLVTPKNPSQKVTITNLSPIIHIEPDGKDSLFLDNLENPADSPAQGEDKQTKLQNPESDLLTPACNLSQPLESSLQNLESIQVFKQELQKEYPELVINSGEVSSFHTNELKEFEETCKEPASVRSKNLESIPAEADSDPVPEEEKEKDSIKVTSNNFTRPSQACFRTSKFSSFQLESRDFSNLQTSYMKASFLHTSQEQVSREIPRCHLNLSTSEISPIYFSYRIGKDSRVKTSAGVGPVDSLRSLMLRQEEVVKEPEKKNIYDRNFEWKQEKQKMHQKIRESLEIEHLKSCTFDPFPKSNKKSESFQLKSHSNLVKAPVEPVVPKRTLQYSGLSPFDGKISYSDVSQSEKFLAKVKPMVNYKQVNLLN